MTIKQHLSRRELLAKSGLSIGLSLSTGKTSQAQILGNPPSKGSSLQALASARILPLVLEQEEARLAHDSKAPAIPLMRIREVHKDGREAARTPVIRVKQGEAVTIRLENRLPFATSLHIRGLRGENMADGVPGLTGLALAPGEAEQIPLYTKQAGTFLLTALTLHAMTEANARLLHAILLIEEATPMDVDADIALALADWRMDGAGTLQADFANLADRAQAGRLGNRLLVNAAPAPLSMDVRPGSRVRVRLVNAANARVLPLSVTNMQAQVIAVDSTPCEPFDPLRRSATLSPATRVEMILDLPIKAGEVAQVEAKLGDPTAAGLPIFIFRTVGEGRELRGAIPPLPAPDLPEEIKLQAALRAEMVITGGIQRGEVADEAALAARFPDPAKIFRINNGAQGGYDGKPLARLKRGQAFVLTIANKTAFPQVIGVHGHAFRLLHALDDGWDPYFLDTLFIAPGATQRIAMVAQNPGKWAIRSTIAEHYASGVAAWFEVG